MRKADFQARIKKIEIVNKVLADGWAQAIRVQLDEIELTNENLLELRQFRPNEPVTVIIKAIQPTLFEAAASRVLNEDRRKSAESQELARDDMEESENFLTFIDEDKDGPPAGKVVKEFKI
jgi:hypothetical protein